MSINRNKAAAVQAGGHWLHLDKRACEIKGRRTTGTVAVCLCGWESEPSRYHAVAFQAGVAHSNEHQARVPDWQDPLWGGAEADGCRYPDCSCAECPAPDYPTDD